MACVSLKCSTTITVILIQSTWVERVTFYHNDHIMVLYGLTKALLAW